MRQPQRQTLSAGNDTTVAQLTLPADAAYVVTASTNVGNNTSTAGLVGCTLLQNSNPLESGSAQLPGASVFAATITLNDAVDTTNGSNVKLSCNPDSAGSARNTVITAIRVGALHTQTPTP